MKGIYLTYEEFKHFCNEEAFLWFIGGPTYEDLTDADIVAGYPDGYFTDEEADDHDSKQAFYTPEEIAKGIMSEMYSCVTWCKGKPYFLTEPAYYDFKDWNGYEHWCARAVNRHNQKCLVWWIVTEDYELDEDACDWSEADAVDMND